MTFPLRRITAAEAIVESLKERITSGEFEPGAQFPSEQQLQKQYAISRLTLREALARLAALGIIRIQHGKGAFVAENVSLTAVNDVFMPLFPHYEANRMNDLIEARSLIESEMAARAAELRTEQDIQRLGALIDCPDEILQDPKLFAEMDHKFHQALAEISDNQFILIMYRALYKQIRSFLMQYSQSIVDRRKALDRHRPILKAIVDRDIENARKLAKEHAGICASYINNVIPNERD